MGTKVVHGLNDLVFFFSQSEHQAAFSDHLTASNRLGFFKHSE